MTAGVILYGPPAVGKDTITHELERLGPYVQFRRLKCGPGRTAGYRMITPEQLDNLSPTDVLYKNQRYDSTYVVDRQGLEAIWAAGSIPVVHLGQPEAVSLLKLRTPGTDWTVVDLHCPIRVLRDRISDRDTGDEPARMAAARATPRLEAPNLAISTLGIGPEVAAQTIHRLMSGQFWRI